MGSEFITHYILSTIDLINLWDMESSVNLMVKSNVDPAPELLKKSLMGLHGEKTIFEKAFLGENQFSSTRETQQIL